ncbi:hypothetical protein V8G54_014781 [Vigna mungo]|uniref:Ubiquitin-like protease family profile domain-containing protein n=1 Tax=Vigna mungo TaxID=3915 RepID=A0AAQ3NJQ2_VIGMU
MNTVLQWQCRGWVKSSYVVDMNSLLQSRHERRIQQTPFKWFLEIEDPIELNMKMMKQLVCRWVPSHQSFRVRQEMVPFNVFDVVMTLGLGVGGLEVPFDETVVGKVGELFNSKTITLKDMITIFNNIVVNEDVDVDVIEDSLSISGAAAVLQLWMYERLSLHGNNSLKVFPRIVRFCSLDYGTPEIEVLFQKGEVEFDWYLSSSDHQNPIIRAALYMGDVGTNDEAPQKGDGSYESALASRVEKIKRNIQRMRNLKDEIGALRKELSHPRNMRKFEQYPSVDVAGQGNEEAATGAAHEAAAHVEAAAEQGSGHATPFNDRDADDEVGDEESVEQPRTFIDIADDEEAEVNGVEPMVVEPLYTFVGDPRETVDVFTLYYLATRKGIVQSYVCEIMGQLLTTKDCNSLGYRECVDNMVIIFAATMFMYFEKRSTGSIKRIIFSPMFATHLLEDNKKRIAKRHVWQLSDYQAYFHNDLVRVEELLNADWVFIPVVSSGHWWCYALKVCSIEFFVIDSLAKGIRGRSGIDRSIGKNIEQLWGLLKTTLEGFKIGLKCKVAKIPVQPNTFDCGVIMMKVFEIWDGEDNYDGKNMPNYTTEQLTEFRKKYLIDWILDDDNVRRFSILKLFGLL